MKEKIAAILMKRYPFWRNKSIEHICQTIADINSGKIDRHDWLPQSEDKVTYEDMLYALELENFITIKT